MRKSMLGLAMTISVLAGSALGALLFAPASASGQTSSTTNPPATTPSTTAPPTAPPGAAAPHDPANCPHHRDQGGTSGSNSTTSPSPTSLSST